MQTLKINKKHNHANMKNINLQFLEIKPKWYDTRSDRQIYMRINDYQNQNKMKFLNLFNFEFF